MANPGNIASSFSSFSSTNVDVDDEESIVDEDEERRVDAGTTLSSAQ